MPSNEVDGKAGEWEGRLVLYVAACASLTILALAWLYLGLDALVNGDPFKWAWRKVRRQPPP